MSVSENLWMQEVDVQEELERHWGEVSKYVAALFGSLMPMVFARINIDPAVATGPFVTTSIDIISVLFYFVIATTLLGL